MTVRRAEKGFEGAGDGLMGECAKNTNSRGPGHRDSGSRGGGMGWDGVTMLINGNAFSRSDWSQL